MDPNSSPEVPPTPGVGRARCSTTGPLELSRKALRGLVLSFLLYRAARALAPLAPLALNLVLSPLAWLCGCGVGARLFALLRHVAALFRSCRGGGLE